MHKPGHIRQAFYEQVLYENTDVVFFNDELQAHFERMDVEEKKRWLAGQLWHCTDIMSSDLCAELNLQQGSTYAQAARLIRQ